MLIEDIILEWKPITDKNVYFSKDKNNVHLKSRKTGIIYSGKKSGLGTQATLDQLRMQMKKAEGGISN